MAALVRAVLRGNKAAALAAFEQLDDEGQRWVLNVAPAFYRWLDPENDEEQNA